MFAQMATLQALLEGVDLPASRADLIRYARLEDREAAALLERLPNRQYTRIDEVGEALAPVQPIASSGVSQPRAESGAPPGGDEYAKAYPTPGRVRQDAPPENPPQKAIEQQTKTQNAQKERQQQAFGG